MSENITQRASEAAAPAFMELYAQKARLLLRGERELLSAGMTGVVQVAFNCSEDWNGLKKTAVFSNGALTVDVPEERWQGNVCPIPRQVLAAAGKTITVGLYGTDGETQVLPTVWCALGRVEPGAAPSYSIALSPEAPIWEQLQMRLGEVEAAAPFTVQVVSMRPVDDDSVIVSLSHDFAQIEGACATGRLVVMEMFGGKLPLTRLISGSRAEFTGAVFTTGGAAYYTHCIVPNMGDALMYTLPIGSQLDASGLTEAVEAALEEAKRSGEFDGAPGPRGPAGTNGKDGADGGYYSVAAKQTDATTLEVSFAASQAGMPSIPAQSVTLPKGVQGEPGAEGYTPQKGVDYWTEADQEDIVRQVIFALGTPVFGRVDADNVIILTGELADGTYTLKYENAAGSAITIGTISITPKPNYTNVLPLAINSDGTPYNGGQGWKQGYRINSACEEVGATTSVTGFIPATVADKLYIYDMTVARDASNHTNIVLYDENFEPLGRTTITALYDVKDEEQIISEGVSFDDNGSLATVSPLALRWWHGKDTVNKTAYVRFTATTITGASIITINQPIV